MKFVLFVTLIWSILDSGWSITDEDLMRLEAQMQVLTNEMLDLKTENQDLRIEVQNLRNENRAGQTQMQVLMQEMDEVKSENEQMKMEIRQIHGLKVENSQLHARMDHLKVELSDRVARLEETCGLHHDLVQNTTIEERVTFLELQMTEVQEDLVSVDEDIDFLFQEQVIQDERIFNVEERTLDLDERVEVLEAGGGGGGNVTALEERVETLEGTAAEHEADIDDLESTTSNLDGRVETLEGETSDLGTRLTAAETLIEELQVTDTELDARITDLEEGGGGASNETTIAFYAVMSDSDDGNIPFGSTIIFSEVQLNEGNGYDPATGVFRVPSGGEGYYYFSTYFRVDYSEYAYIDLRLNDVTVCTTFDDTQDATDGDNTGCSAVVFLEEGDEVENVYRDGTDSTPVVEVSSGIYNGFTGFRI